MIVLDIIETILEIALAAMFVRAFINNDKEKILKYGIAVIIVLLIRMSANTYQ